MWCKRSMIIYWPLMANYHKWGTGNGGGREGRDWRTSSQVYTMSSLVLCAMVGCNRYSMKPAFQHSRLANDGNFTNFLSISQSPVLDRRIFWSWFRFRCSFLNILKCCHSAAPKIMGSQMLSNFNSETRLRILSPRRIFQTPKCKGLKKTLFFDPHCNFKSLLARGRVGMKSF